MILEKSITFYFYLCETYISERLLAFYVIWYSSHAYSDILILYIFVWIVFCLYLQRFLFGVAKDKSFMKL